MARFLLCSLLCVLFSSSVLAQSSPVHVKWFDREGFEQWRPLHQEIAEAFDSELKLRGYPDSGQGMNMFFRAEEMEFNEETQVFLSLVESFKLRDEVIEAGAKNQIWYAGQTEPEDFEEGKWVREYMTKEVLANMVQVTNVVQLVFPTSELNRTISNYLDEREERTRCALSEAECD